MALEQLYAFLDDKPLESLGSTVAIGPDDFPLLQTSDLKAEHEHISELLIPQVREDVDVHLRKSEFWNRVVEGDLAERTRLYLALLERRFAHEARLVPKSEDWSVGHFFGYGSSSDLMKAMLERGVDEDQIIGPTLQWASIRRGMYYETQLLESIFAAVTRLESVESVKPSLVALRSQLCDGEGYGHNKKQVEWIDSIIGDGLWQSIIPGEVWTDTVIAQLELMTEDVRDSWIALLEHCHIAKSAKPSARWLKASTQLLKSIGPDQFRSTVVKWFALVDKARSRPALESMWEATDDRQRIHDLNGNILRGLLWICPSVGDSAICRSIGQLAISAYRKARGIGPRAVKVGNAAVNSLGEIATHDAVAQLAILKVRVKFGTAQKGIEKALVATAERVGIPRDELEEMSVPSYGLTDVGLRSESLGDITAELHVAGRKPELRWLKEDGKQQKSVPASVKRDHADDLKELKQAAKDIEKMLPAQSARIEQTYLAQKEWELPQWRERYLDHPLVGTLARRLIWRFSKGRKKTAAIWSDGNLVDHKDKPVDWIDDDTKVRLWHPLDEPKVAQITAWRDWLTEHEVRQPFKQAHREVYLLTDAERNTQVYSNRIAAHVLKQHQFNALCAARNWKNRLRLMVDDEFPPAHIELPAYNLRAEFWIDGAGDEYGTDTNETGTYLYLATDQVRFYQSAAATNWAHAGGGGYGSAGTDRDENQPLPLEDIPPLVLSEVMRDVDLFVGVASVGNDPNWADGGPEGRYRDYWHSYSFGDLSTTAATRKQVLENLVPRLKIADRCTFSDRFLVVRGDIRTYRIHLGSGNILMEPNDEYLCIVPKQSTTKQSEAVFLPFEGDNTLSIILSKAMLLADDTRIKDSTIVSQIKR